MTRSVFVSLVVLASLFLSVACGAGQESEQGNNEGRQGEQAGPKQEETTTEAMGNIPISGVIGESIETPQFDYRILDVFTTDHYYYLEDPLIDAAQDAFSEAGKFVVVTYSVTNTSPQEVTANLGARLFVEADGKTETYEESDQTFHPYSGGIIGGPDIAPRQMLLGQFIFDVPTDVEPEMIAVLYEDEMEEPRGEAGAVDLTDEVPEGPRPKEILALQYEYSNMYEWGKAYELFAQESKDRVSEQEYTAVQERDAQDYPTGIRDYSFPSVEINGDRAIIERVFTYTDSEGGGQDKATQEAVKEDEGWRILMRDDQYEIFEGGLEETTG